MHKSTSSLEKLDENFYGAFQQHYEFLMDKGLIETCQVSLKFTKGLRQKNFNLSIPELRRVTVKS